MKLKFKLFVVLALLISISSLPSNVFCTTLTWEFTGHITGIDIPLETLSVGDNFTGFFSYSYENTPTPDFGGGTYNSNDNLSIEYGVYFDDFSTSGTASWMHMEDETFPSVPSEVWGHNSFIDNPELGYIEDLVLSPDLLIILAEHSSTPLFHIYGDLDTFESGGSGLRPEPVPEPTTLMLLGTAIFAFAAPIRKLLVNLGITL
jgi:hypothetical protein